jgi:hypothetical protein
MLRFAGEVLQREQTDEPAGSVDNRQSPNTVLTHQSGRLGNVIF